MADETYVMNGSWIREVGRPDLIDDVADQFERPVAVGMVSYWSRGEVHEQRGWPRPSRGWRSMDRLHPRTLERRAG
jgi:hypothetical protein